MPNIVLTGIINCTPDSFSDGSPNPTPATFLERAMRLIDQGANALDIGGDSTRPGSTCVSDHEEWSRIEPLLTKLAQRVPISVDTHKYEVARRAIDAGAAIINDISNGSDWRLIEAVIESRSVDYVCMFNSNPQPHTFGATISDPVQTINSWAEQKLSLLEKAGLDRKRVILDTGLGAFISPDPSDSYQVIERYWEIAPNHTRRMFGCSRKGFLKQPNEVNPSERDQLSAELGATVAKKAPEQSQLYLRVHNILAQLKKL
jgi:dihydropteroate synthase